MKLVNASHKITTKFDRIEVLRHLEECGRECYQSEHLVTDDSYLKFIKMIMNRGHLSVIEHHSVSIKFINDRGISHEEVRHRLCSFSQESTRYCNYNNDNFDNEITVVDPKVGMTMSPSFMKLDSKERCAIFDVWYKAQEDSEIAYNTMIQLGCPPEFARGVLTNALKTSIVITANHRQWREVFTQRAVSKGAHPQIREVMIPALHEMNHYFPEIYGDLVEELKNAN